MTARFECHGIIPARFASKRFPGKPLADILGKPMIWHVYQRARQCPGLSGVVLATDDHRIMARAQALEIPALMTRPDHPSGTDRVLEAADALGLSDDAVVVNIQGDEPALNPEMLTDLTRPFDRGDFVQVTTLANPIDSGAAMDPDLVKVVFDADGRALYFSRSPIPYPRGLYVEGFPARAGEITGEINGDRVGDTAADRIWYGHIGLYAFRMPALRAFVEMGPGRLEKVEKLEQLRLLENGIPIQVALTEHRSLGVDRPEDIEQVERLMKG